jgi:hypothetical protein
MCLVKDMTIQETSLFLSDIVQVGPNQRGSLKDFWSTLEQIFAAFYGKGMRRNRFFHILRFLYFNEKTNEPNKTDENYDQLLLQSN